MTNDKKKLNMFKAVLYIVIYSISNVQMCVYWVKCKHLESECIFKSYVCTWFIVKSVFFSSKLKATGQDVFHRVCELLRVKELHYFGLTLVKSKNWFFPITVYHFKGCNRRNGIIFFGSPENLSVSFLSVKNITIIYRTFSTKHLLCNGKVSWMLKVLHGTINAK